MWVTDSLLSIKSLSKRYGKIEAVKNLNLDVKRGEVVGFVFILLLGMFGLIVTFYSLFTVYLTEISPFEGEEAAHFYPVQACLKRSYKCFVGDALSSSDFIVLDDNFNNKNPRK